MKRVVGLAGLIVVLGASVAEGQTVPAAAPATAPAAQAPLVRREEVAAPGTRWFLGGVSGLQMVGRNAPILGGEFGIRIRKNVQVVFEGGRFSDVVTDSRVAEVKAFGTYLQQTQGLPASADIDAPAWFAMLGARYTLENSRGVRPYVMATGGWARVEYRPTFILNNRDVTTSVGQYGITMGRDLLGPGGHLAYTGGAGLIFGDRWYLDLGFRLTRIQTPEHATNVRRINIGIGHRF